MEGLRKKIESTAPQDPQVVGQLEEQRRAAEEEVAKLRHELANQNSEFKQQILALEQRRTTELRELYANLESRLESLKGTRDSRESVLLTPSEDEKTALSNTAYTDLTRQPSLVQKVRMAGPRFVIYVFILLSGIMGLAFSQQVAELFMGDSKMNYERAMIIMISGSGLYAVGAAVLIWRGLSQVEDYLDFSRRIFRELFVLGAKSADLIKADDILRTGVQKYGPGRGIEHAEVVLAEEFPELSHLRSKR